MDWTRRPLTLVLPCLFRAPFEVTRDELCGALDAARAAGFAGASVWVVHLDALAAQGMGPAQVGRAVAERGLGVSMLSAFSSWASSPLDARVISGELDALLDRAAELGTRRIMAAARGPLGGSLESTAAAFGKACEQARACGLEISLEFLPGTGIGNFRSAWDLVRRSAAPNAGIVLDAMQWQRAGCETHVLASVPGNSIHMLQLCDGPADPASCIDLGRITQRDLPGEGGIDLADLMARVDERGAEPSIELEVFHPALQAAGAAEAARRMVVAARKTLASVSRASGA